MGRKKPPKRIVLTGVSRGLGLAMAESFISRGHTVYGCARSGDVVDRLRRRHAHPHNFEVVDISRGDMVRWWANCVLDDGGGPDLLINNAALINRGAPLWKVPEEEFSRLIDVNIKGTANVLRSFLPAMIERQRGVIVNFSSSWGRSTAPDVAPYCTTKWAIEGLTRALADELPRGMAAIPLNPGLINTEMLKSCFGKGAACYPDANDWAGRAVPMLLALGPEDNGQPLAVRG